MDRSLAPSNPIAPAAPSGVVRRAVEILYLWHVRVRERAHLAALGPEHLADMGLTRDDAARLSARPFWRE